MATLHYGYRNTGSSPDLAHIAAGEQLAYVPDPLGSTVIFYEMGARAGRNTSSTPTCRMGIGETTNDLSSGTPDNLRSYTDSFTLTTLMTAGSEGAVFTRSLNTKFTGQAGDAFALVMTCTNAIAGMGMVNANALPGKQNYNFYRKANASTIPTDPIGGAASYEGHMTLWATGEVNVAPDAPTSLSPAGTVVSTDVTPQMLSSFNDPNETLPDSSTYDRLEEYRIQVRRKSDSVMFWDFTADASASEQTNRQVNRTYAGTTLVGGITYQQRVQHRDRPGAWGAWSAWTDFTINAGGTVVTTTATPTGKQNSATPGPFVAQWSHPNPLSTNAAIVRILDSAGNVVRTMSQSSPYATIVASGSNISVPWANTGFTALTRGGAGYNWQMQGRDSANAWSPWSKSVPFSVNATPNVPSSLSPTGSQTLSSAPKLSAVATDQDDISAALTVTAEILRADGTAVTRSMPWNGTTSRHEYQTVIGVNEVQRITRGGTVTGGTYTITVPANTRGAQSTTAAIQWNADATAIRTALEALPNVGAGRVSVTGGPLSTATTVDITFLMELSATDLTQITVTSSLTGTTPTLTPSTVTAGVNGDWSGFQTLQWRALASDGTSSSAYSSYATFLYGAGPAVTVTAPADEATVATSGYRVTWTVPSGGPQVKYRVVVTWVNAQNVPITTELPHDSGEVTSTNLFYDIPAILRNGRRYQVVVTVTNATPLSGSSQAQEFQVTFTPPAAPTGFVATPEALHAGSGSDAVRLNWNAVATTGTFVAYDLYRTALGPAAETGKGVADIEYLAERRYVRRITNAAQTAFIDGNVQSGVAYRYEIEVVTKQGLDELRSAAAQATVSVDMSNVVLTAALEPETFGIELRHKAGRGGFLSSSLKQQKRKVVPVGGRKARTVASAYLAWDDKGVFELVSDGYLTADERFRRLLAVVERGGTLCLRAFTGFKRYVTIDGFEYVQFSSDRYQVSLVFSEEWFQEGELT